MPLARSAKNFVAAPFVEIGMPVERCLALRFAQMIKSAEVMVAITLDMVDAEHRHGGEIGLQ